MGIAGKQFIHLGINGKNISVILGFNGEYVGFTRCETLIGNWIRYHAHKKSVKGNSLTVTLLCFFDDNCVFGVITFLDVGIEWSTAACKVFIQTSNGTVLKSSLNIFIISAKSILFHSIFMVFGKEI